MTSQVFGFIASCPVVREPEIILDPTSVQFVEWACHPMRCAVHAQGDPRCMIGCQRYGDGAVLDDWIASYGMCAVEVTNDA